MKLVQYLRMFDLSRLIFRSYFAEAPFFLPKSIELPYLRMKGLANRCLANTPLRRSFSYLLV